MEEVLAKHTSNYILLRSYKDTFCLDTGTIIIINEIPRNDYDKKKIRQNVWLTN